MEKKMVIRVDGSVEIGLGHITRCLALATKLKKEGIEIFFLLKHYNNLILKKIKKKNFKVQKMPVNLNLQEDLNQLLGFCEEIKAMVVCVDLYGLNEYDEENGYLMRIKKKNLGLVVFDDFEKLSSYPVDIIINFNYGSENLNYESKNKFTKLFLGHSYFIPSDDLLLKLKKRKKINEKVKKILISFGGSEEGIKKASRFLLKMNEDPYFDDIEVVLIGKINLQMKKNYNFVENIENPYDLYSETDLAIIAGGITKYELALLGIPSIIISIAPHQRELMTLFQKEGTCKYIGEYESINDEAFLKILKNLIENFEERSIMSEKSYQLFKKNRFQDIVIEIKSLF